MKKKTKMLALLEIVIVLCSVLLVTLPAIAADQNHEMQKVSASTITTASKDDYVLGIYGNANEDDTIDMRDLTYVKLIFFGKKPETELADAKYDGKINPLDFIQIKLIIVGKEKELTATDSFGRAKTFKLPLKRIIAVDDNDGEPIRLLGAEDKVVGVGTSLITHYILLPEMSKLPTVVSGGGAGMQIDYEKVLSLKSDIFMAPASWFWKTQGVEIEKKIEPHGITVFLLSPHHLTEIVDDIRKLGYLIGKVDKAGEFVEFHEGCLVKIKDRTFGLSDDKKPRVYIEAFNKYRTPTKIQKSGILCTMAGGINIANDLEGKWVFVDPEWVIEQNPDIIIKQVSECGFRVADITKIKEERDEIMNRPELANVNAVKNGKVYVVSNDIALSGLHGFVCIAYWAKWFHPDLFEDLDPEAIHQEYIDRFLRIDYDVKKGTFVYPPLED